MKKFWSNPPIKAHSFCYCMDISSHFLAQVCYFVDKRDLGGKESIGRVLYHLCRCVIRNNERGVDKIQRTVKVFHDGDCLGADCSDYDPIRAHKIFNGRTLAEKFRV